MARLRCCIWRRLFHRWTGASADPQRLERQAREWQERLRAIADVFGAEFPVYQVITKCGAIPFFPVMPGWRSAVGVVDS